MERSKGAVAFPGKAFSWSSWPVALFVICHPAWPVAWKSLPGRKTKTTTTKPEQQQQTKTKRDHGRTGEGDDRGLVHPLIPSILLHQLLVLPPCPTQILFKTFPSINQSINQSTFNRLDLSFFLFSALHQPPRLSRSNTFAFSITKTPKDHSRLQHRHTTTPSISTFQPFNYPHL